MCSTFKSLLVAHVLSLADAGRVSLDTRVPIAGKDLLSYAPVARRHVGKDLTVRDLCRGTLTTSDNTAANLLLEVVGGPSALTAFLRGQGDSITRNDRNEPDVNLFVKGDPRDTTSPAAMATSLARFAVGNGLQPASRQQFADWLIDNQTGDACLRAGLGTRWRVGTRPAATAMTRATTSPCCGRMRAARRGWSPPICRARRSMTTSAQRCLHGWARWPMQ